MSYATAADLIARFGEEELTQLTDRDGVGLFDAVTVARALEDASALADGYLGARYPLPLSATPALLVGLVCDLARYALWADAVPEWVKDRRDAAIALLRDIAAGRARLDLPSAAPAPAGLVELASPAGRVFARGVR